MEESAASKENARGSPASMLYREHAPMHKLISKIPQRIHRGVIGYDLNLTCIAAHPRFLALGTNAGLVYWYDRDKDVLERLWCIDRRTAVSKIALIETVEFMLAVGNQIGTLSIFQIPRPVDPSVYPCALAPTPESPGLASDSSSSMATCGTELFTISGCHSSVVTALTWARNGMRLFSGDDKGQVLLTELDFVSHTTTSGFLLRSDPPSSVVQLSYQRRLLLVSTMDESFLVKVRDSEGAQENTRKVGVGSRPRKHRGGYGAVFCNSGDNKLLSVRPKNTLYLGKVTPTADCGVSSGGSGECSGSEATTAAGFDCQIEFTVLLSRLLRRPHPEMPLLNPVIFRTNTPPIASVAEASCLEEKGHEFERFEDDECGLVASLADDFSGNPDGESYIVYNRNVLHVVRPRNPAVMASCRGLRRVTDLSTASSSGAAPPLSKTTEHFAGDEIFVLEGPRNVIRLGRCPDRRQTQEDNRELENKGINPLGDDQPEGTGLETVSSNFLSISESVMVSSISAAQERLMKMAPLASRWGGLFGSSLNGNIAAEELEKSRPTSPAHEAVDADLDMEGIGERDFPQEGVLAPQSKIARQEKYKKSPKKSLELGGSNNGSEALLEDDEEKIVGKLRLELWSPPNDEGDSFELAREDHDSADREAQLLEALQLKDFMPKGKNPNQTMEGGTQNETMVLAESKDDDKEETASIATKSISSSLVYGPPSETSLQ